MLLLRLKLKEGELTAEQKKGIIEQTDACYVHHD
jgi:hypothetical protein